MGTDATASPKAGSASHFASSTPNSAHPTSPNTPSAPSQPVRDHEEVEVLIPLSSSATLFRAGDSLRLMVAGRYLQPRNPFFGHFPTHYEPSRRGKATITWAPGRPSSLEIPVIPRGGRS